MKINLSVQDQDWFLNKNLQTLFDLLNQDGEEMRVAGGAIRNALLGTPVGDIDLATSWAPQDVVRLCIDANIKHIPTGIEHGTVTLIVNGDVFEITSLREDIETDGRHAKVKFGKDWQKDAERRDLTINGLYANAKGDIIDLVGGLEDIDRRNIRFIGDAETRIGEDYLRVLRFFRFFAHYGHGRPDAEGLKACAKAIDGLGHLSAERVWKETKLLLSAKDPTRALLWMRTTGVLTAILPQTEKWGIDSVGPLVEAKQSLEWDDDPLLMLAAIIPPNLDRVAELASGLKLSKAETQRLSDWAATPKIAHDMAETALDRALYFGAPEGYRDVISLALVSARNRAQTDDDAMHEVAGYTKLLKRLSKWEKPVFPIAGSDLQKQGIVPGKQMGELLKALEKQWVDSNFALSKKKLLAAI